MTSIPTQLFYHFVLTNIGPIAVSALNSMYTNYTANQPHPTIFRQEVDDERELELIQMDRLLKWMKLVFEDSIKIPNESYTESHRAYKQELYSIYVTICSDYIQYQDWKKYNDSLWMGSSYRNKNTKGLAKKILGDVKLFKEGLEMFSMFGKL
jgi:hypothetical protein